MPDITRKDKLRSPISWFGGKGNFIYKLLPLIPKHKIYVEVYGGGAQILFAKKQTPIEIYNDLDSALVNFFRVIKDADKFERFKRMAVMTPYSREEFNHWCDNWEKSDDDVERAYGFYVVCKMSFAGCFGGGWSYAKNTVRRGIVSSCSRWLSSIDLLPEIHNRLMQIQIEHDDGINTIKRYDSNDTFFYCLTDENLIRTFDERLIKIKDISEGEFVFGGKKILKKFERYYCGKIFTVKCNNIPFELKLTPEHKLLYIKGKKPELRQEKRNTNEFYKDIKLAEVRNLNIGDYVIVPFGGYEKNIDFYENFYYCSITRKGKKRKEPKLRVCSELYRFLGYYLAEGHIQYCNNRPYAVYLSFGLKELDTYVKDACFCIKESFDLKPVIKVGCPHSTSVQIHLYSATVAEFVSLYIKGTAKTKELHQDLMVAPILLQKEILVGWLRGDGSFWSDKRNRVKLSGTTSSLFLSYQIFIICLRCGFIPFFRRRFNKLGNRLFECYDVCFSGKDAKSLGYDIPCKRLRTKVKFFNNYALLRIKGIETENYSGSVYDLDVDGDNLFSAPFILVHNCDPPYLPETRKSGGYKFEMTKADHEKMLETILSCKGNFLISGYDNELYNSVLKGWNRKEWSTLTGGGDTHNKELNSRARKEVVWYNYKTSLLGE